MRCMPMIAALLQNISQFEIRLRIRNDDPTPVLYWKPKEKKETKHIEL